jgi:hypothetical protein
MKGEIFAKKTRNFREKKAKFSHKKREIAKFCVFREILRFRRKFIYFSAKIPKFSKLLTKTDEISKKTRNFRVFLRKKTRKFRGFLRKFRKIFAKNAKFHNFAFYREILRFFLKFRLFLKN